MEPTLFIYIGTMTLLGLFAVKIGSKKCINLDKEYIRKKGFKHYRYH